MSDWIVRDARRDPQSVTPAWQPAGRRLIDGVAVKEILSVVVDGGHVTEIWRRDWGLDALPVDEVFQRVIHPGELSAWHAHRETTERLFCGTGAVKLVLFDGRAASPTAGLINELRLGELRPAVVVVPPGVWHGVMNIGAGRAILVNAVDRAYRYDDPDHWRAPADSPDIPYRWR